MVRQRNAAFPKLRAPERVKGRGRKNEIGRQFRDYLNIRHSNLFRNSDFEIRIFLLFDSNWPEMGLDFQLFRDDPDFSNTR